MVNPKIRTDVPDLSVGTVASLTPEKLIPKKEKSKKPLAISPQRTNPISNQDINMLGTKKIKLFHHN